MLIIDLRIFWQYHQALIDNFFIYVEQEKKTINKDLHLYYKQFNNELNLISTIEEIVDIKKDRLYFLLKKLRLLNTKQIMLQQHEGLYFNINKIIDENAEAIRNQINSALLEYKKICQTHFNITIILKDLSNDTFLKCTEQIDNLYATNLSILRDSLIDYYYLNHIKEKISHALKIFAKSTRFI